ncbi:MAG: hypothetical protein ACYC69_17160 [Thermodesulfovibrionales bacterium]
MSYTMHPSEKLVSMFREKPWQGCNPFTAQFLFVGLDANYAADIETSLPEVFDYLRSGVDFWQTTGVHHPFRLPQYKGSGKKYHDKFAEIGFTSEYAKLVSFVELLHLPTIGISKLNAGDLSSGHLHSLADIIEHGEAKYIFMSSSVATLMRQTDVFPWVPEKPIRMDGDLAVLRDQNGRTIYSMYHLSCYGWQLEVLNRQIKQVRNIVESLKRS